MVDVASGVLVKIGPRNYWRRGTQVFQSGDVLRVTEEEARALCGPYPVIPDAPGQRPIAVRIGESNPTPSQE